MGSVGKSLGAALGAAAGFGAGVPGMAAGGITGDKKGDEIGRAIGASGAFGAIGDIALNNGQGIAGIGGALGFGGPKMGGDGGLGQIRDAALGMYGEGSADYAAQAANRGAFGTQLADRALGKGPSLAGAQMQQAQDRNLSQQLAASKANRAVNPALAFRQVQQLGAQGNQQIAQASGIAAIQEQRGNQAAYQDYLTGIQTQRNNSLAAGSGAAQASAAKSSADANAQNAYNGNMMGMVGSLGALAMSDENQKTNVQDANPKSFLEALSAKTYNYKNPNLPGAGEGQHMSVMAQDLESAGPVGQSMVQDTQNGKMVDYGKGFGAMLAAQVDLNKRLSAMESKKGKK